MPDVTAIIPTIGRESLRRSVESVLSQTLDVKAVVVLDRPAERDAVATLLVGLEHKLVCTRGAVGGAGARNAGILAADTEYVAFLDDDDTWRPEKSEVQLIALRTSDNAQAVSATAMNFHRGETVQIVPSTAPPAERSSSLADYVVQRPRLRYGTHALQTSTLMLSRALALETMWDEGLKKHQDWDFVARLSARSDFEIVWIGDPLVDVYQASQGSISKSHSWKSSHTFLERHRSTMSERASADFIFTQIVRSALATGDRHGLATALRENRTDRPHLAAIVVGASGLAELVRGRAK